MKTKGLLLIFSFGQLEYPATFIGIGKNRQRIFAFNNNVSYYEGLYWYRKRKIAGCTSLFFIKTNKICFKVKYMI